MAIFLRSIRGKSLVILIIVTHTIWIYLVRNHFFHCLNRSVTIFGKNRLADYFKYAYSFKNLIQIRQKSILELSGHFDFRQKIQLVFYGQKSTEKERLDLIEWLSSSPAVKQKRLINILRYTLPVITNSLIILSLMGLVAVQFPIMMVILQLFIVSVYGAEGRLKFSRSSLPRLKQFLNMPNFSCLLKRVVLSLNI